MKPNFEEPEFEKPIKGHEPISFEFVNREPYNILLDKDKITAGEEDAKIKILLFLEQALTASIPVAVTTLQEISHRLREAATDGEDLRIAQNLEDIIKAHEEQGANPPNSLEQELSSLVKNKLTKLKDIG
jgi:hypothetical protein